MYLLYQQNIQNQIEGGLMTMDMYKAKVEKELKRDEDMINEALRKIRDKE